MVTSIFKSGRRARSSSAAMRKPDPRKWFENVQVAIGWAIVLMIIGAASGIYLTEVSRTAIIGNNANVLQRRLARVRDANAKVRQSIATEQSINYIKTRAEELNLNYLPTDPATIEYITVVVPAPKVAAPEVAEPLKPPPTTIQEALLIEIDGVLRSVEGVFDGR